MATSTIPSAKEYTYGPIADSYAIKYGVPPEAFRDVIRKASGFDPDTAGIKSGGIANLDSRVVGFDASQVAPSLDYAAREMARIYNQTAKGAKKAVEFLGGDDTPLNDGEEPEVEEDDSYSGRIGAYFKKNAYTILMVLVGGLLILASLYMVIQSSSK